MAGKVALRRTKIIATLGPATDDDAVLRRMIENGLDVARLNFSHGSGEILEQRSQQVARLAAEVGRTVAILGDLQGPKIRIGSFKDGKVMLAEGAPFLLDPDMDEEAGTAEGVSIAYKTLADDVEPGDTLLLDDGQIALTVAGIDGKRVSTTVLTGGALSNKKGINLQGGGLSAPALTRKDEADIQTAADLNYDYLAVSFVRSATDIRQARALFESAGGHGRIVAKIERTEAVDNIESIIEASDAIMVARGDLGVEMGYAGLTGLQKRIIRSTRYGNKIAITATQMMESMIASPLPTRAEVSDVANAVMDGTDAVMLSAETAVGKHPATVIEAMAEVCLGAEKYQTHRYRASHRMDDTFQHVDEAIAMATMYTANHLDVRAIIALTESGTTTQWMSRIRSDIPIFAFTRNERTSRRVTLYRGVYPVAFDITQTNSVRVYNDVCALLFELGLVDPGDRVIFTKGDLSGVAGGTNAMKIISVPDAEIMQAARRRRLNQQDSTGMTDNRFKGTDTYIATEDLMMAVNAGVTLERPILVKGEPGTGKTMLAEEVAAALGMPLFEWHIKSTTKAQQGLYEYDAVARLRDSQLGEDRVHDIANYILKGSLWQAFESEKQPVLLIDEIDKADIEFPNDLLRELDRMEFTVFETGETIQARHRPVIIITSNNEKELPDAFLRRCFFHYIRFPDEDTMQRIVDVHYPGLKKDLLREALAAFFKVREMPGLKKKPSTSELLDWIKLLLAEDIPPEALRAEDNRKAIPPLYGALLKNEQDVHLFEQLVFMNRGGRQ